MRQNVIDFTVMAAGLALLLKGIHDSQLGPHHLVQHIGTTVICDRWITNPIYITETVSNNPITNEKTTIKQTNEYWHVWSIFKTK